MLYCLLLYCVSPFVLPHQVLINFKGFQSLCVHRVAHWLWARGRKPLALALQSIVSQVFHVDIHPAANVGRGVMLDHATGVCALCWHGVMSDVMLCLRCSTYMLAGSWPGVWSGA